MAAGDPQTARAGAQVLAMGGNAVDAICGAALASFVCEPPLTSPAGAGIMMHGHPDRGWSVLDVFARVPGLGGQPTKLDFFDVQIDFGSATQTFHIGRGAAAVPGALRGLLFAHDRYGRLPFGEVAGPATELARRGYDLSSGIAYITELLAPILTLEPATFALVSKGEALAAPGTRLTNPGLARLFEGLVANRRDTLRALENDLIDTVGPTRGGLLSREDLQRWAPVERTPMSVDYRGTRVLLNPPPSAGGGLIALGLRLAERTGLTERRFGEHWPILADILRTTSHVRRSGYDQRLDEPGYLEGLLSAEGIEATLQARQQAIAERSLGSTTHISVLDGDDGAASLTTSNGEGCGHTLSKWGVHVNNFLGEEDINPLGFHAQAPGTSMTTMMSPTIVLREERPVVVLGSGGSNRIRSAVLQGLLNHLGFERPLAQAVADDRMHVEGDQLWFEATTLPSEAVDTLHRDWPGASRFERQNMFFGGIHAVRQGSSGPTGVGDPRRAGAVCAAADV